ncbi:hypothetical protein VNO80_01297 [Phaseolus coccineus]|uniref:Uncharacterized protein n=1 Tax=Phaseolus coccineus TaxID=3886 RepID=A0AAN9RSM9_PHACN
MSLISAMTDVPLIPAMTYDTSPRLAEGSSSHYVMSKHTDIEKEREGIHPSTSSLWRRLCINSRASQHSLPFNTDLAQCLHTFTHYIE